ncbi:CobW family GTP-binding protein [Chloroflexota bacterium]
MIILIVAGFLGSGKTTFILSLARQLVEAGKKVAIIENEVGEIGIDGELIRRSGLAVREIFNGCICCQLSADLVPTLETLAVETASDYIIIEASGVAEPNRILGLLSFYHGPPIQDTHTLTLVDPTRIPELFQILTPLITAQVQPANTIIINKIDIASSDELTATREVLKSLKLRAAIVELSARDKVDIAVPNLIPNL